MLALSVIESWFPILSLLAMNYIGALYVYGFSLITALLFFVIIMYKKALFSELLDTTAYKNLLLTSFWITTLFIIVFIGMRYTTASNMAVIIFLQLLFSYLYFNVIGKEKMHTIHTLGALLMAIGAIIILFPEDFTLNKGDILILIAAAIAPFANLYQKRARQHSSAVTILTFRTIVAIPFVFVLAYFFEDKFNPTQLQHALIYILAIGILVFGLSKIMWIEALHRISITKVSALLAIVPLLTLLFAFLFLDETPTLLKVIAIVPILFGGYLITKPLKTD